MKTLRIRGEEWGLDYIRFMLERLRPGPFEAKRWRPRDALVRKDGSRATIYEGQDFDPAQWDVRRNFWDHDHCVVCNWKFMEFRKPDEANGYTNGYDWLCTECHERFIRNKEAEISDDSERPDVSPKS